MNFDGAGDVALVVEIRILVHLGHVEVRVVQVLVEPVGCHQHGLRVAVLSHCRLPLLSLLKYGEYSTDGPSWTTTARRAYG